ncbi:hypothetical protein K5D56_21500 [Pseudomonas cichorii]|nr:hypothetical protein [Pseudomonas cichorii]MBX8557041.1 hypothetical protein [Pseudomonas cichorii]MBX8591945.1 hypothetical protein [Pseudomonas cichorii]
MNSNPNMSKVPDPEYTWAAGPTMQVACPNCSCTVTTQISVVREDNLPLRPESCDKCGADFEVFPDGKTVPVSVRMAGDPGRKLGRGAEFFQSLIFDPNGARDWPFITEVEVLLTVAWLHMFEDGTQQFIDENPEPAQIYSPRLAPEALELFCKVNIDKYRNFHSEHEAELDQRESVPMPPFW